MGKSYAPCLWHGPVALASSQTQPHFVQLGPRYSTQCFIPDPTSLYPTSLCLVRSLYFKLNANSQTQPHFVHSLYFKLNANSQTQPHFVQLVRSLYFKLNANSQTQPHFVQLDPTSLCLVRSLYFKLNANSQTQPHFVWLGPCISNSMLSSRPNLTLFG
ncbi:hypothetical protein E4T56_gene2581 [Termitomyces sp. T112]|nr:hypothetical protein E4T56_gene2581 [Termitomyces sp. T112]